MPAEKQERNDEINNIILHSFTLFINFSLWTKIEARKKKMHVQKRP